MSENQGRRSLELHRLDEVVLELQRLLQQGYQKTGNWSLGQICRHLRLDLQSSMDGYPRWMYLFAPLRPFIRWLMLPKVLSFNSPSGVRTMSQYVPPENLEDAAEVEQYIAMIERFKSWDESFSLHPGFGIRDKTSLEQLYSAHAAHHLSFLRAEEVRGA